MYLKQSDIFWGTGKEFMKQVMDISIRESYNQGDFLFREGDQGWVVEPDVDSHIVVLELVMKVDILFRSAADIIRFFQGKKIGQTGGG